MTRLKQPLRVLACSVCLALPFAAQATNGYFQHGYGTKNGGMAGAGVALPQDTLTAATNPAGMVRVGNRMDAGVSLFSPMRSYDASSAPSNTGFFTIGANAAAPGQGTVGAQSKDSENEAFLIPQFGYNKMIDAHSSIGVSVYGNGGMNTQYDGGFATLNFAAMGLAGAPSFPGTFAGGASRANGFPMDTPGGSTAGVDLQQLFIAPTYSREFANGRAAWGISPLLAYQIFEARGLGAFAPFSTDPNKLTDNQHDGSFGFGARIGVIGEVAPNLTLAASYQTEMDMDEFDEYKGLFAENGDFDIPQNATVGLAWRPKQDHVLAVDVQWIAYGDVDAIANEFNPAFNQCFGAFAGALAGNPNNFPAASGAAQGSASCLGGENGPGFGWDDMTIVKIGYQWKTSPDWTWRVGVSHGDQPIPESEVLFNILAPGVIENHVTAGFTKQFGKNSELDLGVMYALEEDVEGASPANQNQGIELSMDQFWLSANWGWRF